MRLTISASVVFLVVAWQSQDGAAQVYIPQVPSYRVPTVPPIYAPVARGVGNYAVNKPFSDITPAPTLSPYLALGGRDQTGIGNYFSITRPLLEQQAYNQQEQIRRQQLTQELRTYTQANPYPGQGDPGLRQTGHAAGFMDLSHYYPRMAHPRRPR